MGESYYTDSMRQFVSGYTNKHNFPVEISILVDNFGEFLVLTFNETDYMLHHGQNHFQEIGEYLVGLRQGLKDLGARVTFNIREME